MFSPKTAPLVNYAANITNPTTGNDTLPGPAMASEVLSSGPPVRLSRILVDDPQPSFGSFAALVSNAEALKMAQSLADGQCDFLALAGPSGWGKSHILASVAGKLSLREGRSVVVLSATEWALGMTRHDSQTSLLLDNVQDAIEKPRVKQLLRIGLEKRVRAGRRTLLSFTATRSSRQFRNFLPAPKEWAWAAIQLPCSDERVVVLSHMARAERIVIADVLSRLIARRMRGNGRTISGALKRLKLYGTEWLEDRHILRACGVLDMFFVDNTAWDLREVIVEASSGFPLADDLAAYLMLREAALSEAHVAHFLRVSPSAAYSAAARFARLVETSPDYEAAASAAIRRAVERLSQDC